MKLLYQCEACMSVYSDAEVAKQCEAFVSPEPSHKVGDTIAVKTRYDGIQYAVVRNIALVPNERNGYIATEQDIPANWRPHEYKYLVDDELQLGKEWYTCLIPETSIQ